MFELFYLSDQSGDINGEKYLVAIFDSSEAMFDSLEAAKYKAALENVSHYSVEQSFEDETENEIVFIC